MTAAPPQTLEEFDRLVQEFYHNSSGSSQKEKDTQLNQFSKNPGSIAHVQDILQNESTQPETKFLALQVLENVINTRWNAIGADSRVEIRNFVATRIIGECQQLALIPPELIPKRRVIINKLNAVLVQIVKKEWPQSWKSFIPEVLDSSRRDPFICENNMIILRILSEEIYDFSEDHLTTQKTMELRQRLTEEAPSIFQLCLDILKMYVQSNQTNAAVNPYNDPQKPLLTATLETMIRFLSWMQPQFRLEAIGPVRWFLQHPAIRNTALKCLVEIAGSDSQPEITNAIAELLVTTLEDVRAIVPLEIDLASIYPGSNQSDQQFIQNLAMFLTTLLSKHLKALESVVPIKHIHHAHERLLQISEVDDREIFKVCLEYWTQFAQELYNDMNQHPLREMQRINPLATMGIPELSRNGLAIRKDQHTDVLSKLRVVVIKKMARPEEVLIVENEAGEIVREFVKESDTVQLYKSSRECLVFLTHLDVEDTKNIMTRKLEAQVNGSEWSWNNCNSLCWAIGSISGAMDEATEKQFLVIVIKDLLTLTEQQRGKDNKAVVASNIMYIVGQYPRFLKAHWKFLKTVVNKLFEFMHETHEGVQDMACDTFIKISNKCRRHFVIRQPEESCPFIEDIFDRLHRITSDLSRQQIHTFYEACGFMISAEQNPEQQHQLVSRLMRDTNGQWEQLIQAATTDANSLRKEPAVDTLLNIIKTNIAVCRSVGTEFYTQLTALCTQLLQFHEFYSTIVDDNLSTRTSPVPPIVLTKSRAVTRESCNLLNTFFNRMENFQVAMPLLPHLTPILLKYRQVVPDARDCQVLTLFTTIISRFPPSSPLGDGSTTSALNRLVLESLFNPTLEMIQDDLTKYPDFRLEFYKLLAAITKHDFSVMLSMEPAAFNFDMFMLSVFGAMKHDTSEIGNLGLDICIQLLDQVSMRPPEQANMFFGEYLIRIFQAVLAVLVDPDHKAGFSKQTNLLRRMLYAVRSGQVAVQVYPDSALALPNRESMSLPDRNLMGLTQCAGQLFQAHYPHLNEQQVMDFLGALNNATDNEAQFKQIVRDFLIILCEFPSQSDKLFAEDKQMTAAEAERERAMKVGGLWKPSDFDDEL